MLSLIPKREWESELPPGSAVVTMEGADIWFCWKGGRTGKGGAGKNGKRVRILMRGIWQLSWGGSLDGKALTAKARQEEQLLTDPAKTPWFLKKSDIPYKIFLRKSGIRVTGWTRVICLGFFLKPSFSLSNYKVLMVTLLNVVAQNSGIWTHSKEESIPWWELSPSILSYPRHWMQLFHQAIPKYRPEHILPAHSRCWRQDKEHVGSVRMEIPKILTRFFHVFCSLCTDFPFFPEDELAKSPPSRKMPQTMLKNTGKGSNLSCPEPGTALKGSSNSFVLGKGIGKVLASHWLRFQLVSNSRRRNTRQTPWIPNGIIHVLWSAPGTPSKDSHNCQGTESGNASHISRELQRDIKENK